MPSSGCRQSSVVLTTDEGRSAVGGAGLTEQVKLTHVTEVLPYGLARGAHQPGVWSMVPFIKVKEVVWVTVHSQLSQQEISMRPERSTSA
jgi:hypothetical protein